METCHIQITFLDKSLFSFKKFFTATEIAYDLRFSDGGGMR